MDIYHNFLFSYAAPLCQQHRGRLSGSVASLDKGGYPGEGKKSPNLQNLMDGTEKVQYTRVHTIKAYHDFPCLHFDTNPLLICS